MVSFSLDSLIWCSYIVGSIFIIWVGYIGYKRVAQWYNSRKADSMELDDRY